MNSRSFALACLLTLAGCRTPGSGFAPWSFEDLAARHDLDVQGPLSVCADNLERFAASRAAAFGRVEALEARAGGPAAVLEVVDVAEVRYGVAAAVGGWIAGGLAGEGRSAAPAGPALRDALRVLGRAPVASLASDERNARAMRDGTCVFVTALLGSRTEVFGLYLPFRGALEDDPAAPDPRLAIVRALMPYLEFAPPRDAKPLAHDGARSPPHP